MDNMQRREFEELEQQVALEDFQEQDVQTLDPRVSKSQAAQVAQPVQQQAHGNAPAVNRAETGQAGQAETVDGYLEGAQQRLLSERARAGRPAELSQMTTAELEEEKTFIKYELKRFDDILGAQLGRPLKKADKEPMRPLYSRYHEIKNVLASSGTDDAGRDDGHILQEQDRNKTMHAPVSKTVPEPRGPGPLPAANLAATTEGTQPAADQYQKLKQEKRTLQQKLHQYESEFFKKHGRKMKHHEDIAPVQQEYTEYKRLKGVLASMEAQGLVA